MLPSQTAPRGLRGKEIVLDVLRIVDVPWWRVGSEPRSEDGRTGGRLAELRSTSHTGDLNRHRRRDP